MRALIPALVLACVAFTAAPTARAQVPPTDPVPGASTPVGPPPPVVAQRHSRALGLPWRGRLVRGVQFQPEGPDWVTWDAVLKRTPNRGWRRWGTDVLVAEIQIVLAAYRAAHPEAPRVVIGDLSRPKGGVFDRRFGGLGHASHQNGLDVDVYYPRRDHVLREPRRPAQVDRALAQDLVDRFVGAGAQRVFVGLRVRLKGPRTVVQAIPHHDDHFHVRIHDPDPKPAH